MNGDPITFSISQSAGQTLQEVAGTPDGVFTFNTPRVTADQSVTFTVTASDGALSSTQDETITISDIVRTPLSTQWAGMLSSQTVGANAKQIVSGGRTAGDGTFPRPTAHLVSEDAVSGEDNLHVLTFATDGTFTVGSITTLSAVSGVDPDDWVYVFDNLDLIDGTDLVQYDPNSGSLAVYRDTGGAVPPFEVLATGTFPNLGNTPEACGITTTLVGDDRAGFAVNEFPGILLGTNGNGLRAVLNDGNPRTDPSQTTIGFTQELALTSADSLCAFAVSNMNATGSHEVYGYDPVREDLVPISSPVTSAPTLGTPFSITLPASNMSLVDMKSGIGQAGQAFVAMLFSDGVHEGNHAIVVVQFQNGALTQDLISLPNGVPTELVVASIDTFGGSAPDFDTDLIVVVPDVPYVYVIENESPSTPGPNTFAPISYFEVGFDVQNVTLADGNNTGDGELVTGASDGTISVYRNTN